MVFPKQTFHRPQLSLPQAGNSTWSPLCLRLHPPETHRETRLCVQVMTRGSVPHRSQSEQGIRDGEGGSAQTRV